MKNYRIFLAGMGTLLLVWSIWIGYTWHLFPVYLCLLLIVLSIATSKVIKRKILLTSSIFILSGLSILFLYLFPFVNLPKPSGPYAVGVTYKKVETNRDELFTETEGDTRFLYLKIWYPAKAGVHPNPYLEEGEKALSILAEPVNLPTFPFQQLTEIKTHGFTNAPIAEGRFPLLTFSHGFAGWTGQNTALMEELASQGFIVASIAHSHQAVFAAVDENTLITFPKIVPPVDPNEKVEEDTAKQNLQSRIFVQKSVTDKNVFDLFFRELVVNARVSNEHTVIWANDISSTIDFMIEESSATNSFFHGHVDSQKIGPAGMSYGGAAAAEAALKDQRILAAINMDGAQFGTWINDTIRIPVLFLEAPKSPNNLSMYSPFFTRSTSDIHCLIFKNAAHFNFTDGNLFSPTLKWMGILGDVDGHFMINTLNSIVPDFFKTNFSNQKFQVEKHLIPGAVEEAVY